MIRFEDFKPLVRRWEVVSERFLSEEEKKTLQPTFKVVPSEFGLSAEFTFSSYGLAKNGVATHIPIANDITVFEGEVFSIDRVKVLTLKPNDGEDISIYRITIDGVK